MPVVRDHFPQIGESVIAARVNHISSIESQLVTNAAQRAARKIQIGNFGCNIANVERRHRFGKSTIAIIRRNCQRVLAVVNKF